MYNICKAVCLVVLPFLICGCAGKDFVRPNAEAFKLGQTTYAQVIQQMGEPRTVSDLQVNEKLLKQTKYMYASRLAEEPSEDGAIPARVLQCYFYNDTLVGLVYLSSMKSDSSNFDHTKIESMKKGKTSRTEVIQILGKPTASLITPMVKATSGEAIGYTYQTVRGGALSGFKTFSKTLRISFDDRDIISEIDYQSAGEGLVK